MNKQQAINLFREIKLPAIHLQESGCIDYPLRRQYWNDYVNSLQRGGYITVKQAHKWTQPAFCNPTKKG